MTSYQHQTYLGEFLRDSLPDYLTCGYCSREFVLDNITLFIAHKTTGCYKNGHFRNENFARQEDTSAALTCSSCSREFMTARGLLHHVQEDHKVMLCVQSGSQGFTPNSATEPPPAHSTFVGPETGNTNYFSHTNSASSSLSRDQAEQPTDLSMTCSSSLGKARMKCNGEKCEIIIEPISNSKSAHVTGSASAVPKKRMFLLPNHNPHTGTDWESQSGGDNESCQFNDEDEESRDGSAYHSNQRSDKDKDVSISVTAEYQRDTLHCISLSTEKNDREKHSKLKRLLQQKLPSSEPDEVFAPTDDDDRTTTVVYKVPFTAPRDLEAATLKASSEDSNRKTHTVSNSHLSFLDSPSDKPSTTQTVYSDRNLPMSTLEQSIGHVIRSSVASEIYPEDFEILSLYPNSSQFPSKQFRDSEPNLSFISTPQSPRLVMPDEKYLSSNGFPQGVSQSDFGDNNNISASWKMPSGGDINRQSTTSTSPNAVPMTFTEASSARKEMEYLRNSLNLANIFESHPHNHDTAASYIPFDGISLRGDNRDTPRKIISGEPFLNLLKQQKTRVGAQPETPAALLPTDLSRLSTHLWLGIQSEDATLVSGGPTLPTTVSSTTDHSDVVALDNSNTVFMETDDVISIDGKSSKKRRYPTSRPFKCDSCEQAFNQRIHLKKHMSKHTGVKPFKCQHCDYSTVERSHLKVHYRIHTGEKPYRCMFCDYTTAQNSTLKIHLKRHHAGQGTHELTRQRDNHSQASCSLDDDEWNLQDSFFSTLQPNNQTLSRDKTPSSSGLYRPSARLLPTENSLDMDAKRSVEARSILNTTRSFPVQSVLPLQQVKGESSISASDKSYMKSGTGRNRKFKIVGDDHHGNEDTVSIKVGIKKMKENENTCQELGKGDHRSTDRVNCKTEDEASLLKDVAAPKSFTDIPSSASILVLAPRGDNQRSKDDELDRPHMGRLSHISESFPRNQPPQPSTRSPETTKPSDTDEETSHKITSAETNTLQHKSLTNLMRDEFSVDKGNAQIVFEKVGKASMKKSDLFQQEDAAYIHNDKAVDILESDEATHDLEYDECAPGLTGVAVPVTIPDKEFVRG